MITRACGQSLSLPTSFNHPVLKVITTYRAGELLYYIGQVRNSQGFLKDSFQYQQRALLQFRATLGEDDFYTGLACYQVAMHTMRERDLSATK